jgi:hypothetical protein
MKEAIPMKELQAGEPLQPRMLPDSTWIPNAILKDPTLSAGARLLWVMLGEYQGMSVDCFPSQDMLAAPLGVKVRQFQTFCKELENYTRGNPPEPFPLIEVKRAGVGKERKTRNIYNLLRRPFVAVSLKTNGSEEARLANGGNARYSAHRSVGQAPNIAASSPGDTQSSAHRSEGDAQNTAAALPAIRSDDGAVRSGLALGDTQSSAHRSVGDAQDIAAERAAAILVENDSGAPNGILPDDTQSSAHWSRGGTEDTAERPTIPSDGSGAGGKRLGDTQSFAHRSGVSPQDTAAARRIPSEDVDEVPDGAAAVRAVYAKAQQLRQQQALPLASVIDQYAFRPLGSGDCMLHGLPARCKKCGATVKSVHIMTRVIAGTYCERCCPACHPAS